MYIDYSLTEDNLRFVIDNLCMDAVTELKALFGTFYKVETFDYLKSAKYKYLIRLKSNNEIVGIFGILPQNPDTGGIFLLTTDNIHNGNIITFLRGAKKQIKLWEKDFKLIMDSCYKQNLIVKKWLELLGFKPSEKYQDKYFQIYYKGDLSLFKNE